MSELEKAKQIAAEAFNFKSKAYTTIEQQNEIIKVNRKAFMQILSLSSLTIPKSIADELDKVPNEAKRYVQENGFDDYSILDDFVELREFYEADEDEAFPGFTGLKEFVKDNLNLCALYLAGKALGVDLVKVV